MMKAVESNQKFTPERLELRMEVVDEFVRKHRYWEYSKGRKNYIAEIVGLSREYGYQRRFLNQKYRGQEKVFLLADFVPTSTDQEYIRVHIHRGGCSHFQGSLRQ